MKKKHDFINLAILVKKRPKSPYNKDRSIVDISWQGCGGQVKSSSELQFNFAPVHLGLWLTKDEVIKLANKLLEITSRKSR